MDGWMTTPLAASLPASLPHLDLGDECPGVGDQEGAGLDLQLQLPARLLGERHKLVLHGRADLLQVGGDLVAHAAHLVAAAQVEHGDPRELAHQVEAQARHPLPHGRVRARPDVRVDAEDLQVVLGHDGLDLVDQLVPDAEGRRRAAHVGLARATRAKPGVKAQPDLNTASGSTVRRVYLCGMLGLVGLLHAGYQQRGPHLASREALAEAVELRERAGVDGHALLDVVVEVGGQLLRGERDGLGLDACPHGPLDLVAAAGVDAQAHLREQLQHDRPTTTRGAGSLVSADVSGQPIVLQQAEQACPGGVMVLTLRMAALGLAFMA